MIFLSTSSIMAVTPLCKDEAPRSDLVCHAFFPPHGTVFIKNKQTGRDLITSRLLGLPGAGDSRTYHRYVGYRDQGGGSTKCL